MKGKGKRIMNERMRRHNQQVYVARYGKEPWYQPMTGADSAIAVGVAGAQPVEAPLVVATPQDGADHA